MVHSPDKCRAVADSNVIIAAKRDSVIHDYAEYVRSFVEIREPRLHDFVRQSITDEAGDPGNRHALAESIRTGHPYQTRLDPPPPTPASPTRHEGVRVKLPNGDHAVIDPRKSRTTASARITTTVSTRPGSSRR